MFLALLLLGVSGITFKEWTSKHSKSFSPIESLRRRAIFIENTKYVNEINSKNLSYTLSNEGPFAVLSEEERAAFLKPINIGNQNVQPHKSVSSAYPDSIDYRYLNGKSYVTPVRDQGSCGSCYAFSATAIMESSILLRNEKLVPSSYQLSVAEIISCASKYNCHGCQYGDIEGAVRYVKDNGIGSESSFPYKAKDDVCRETKKVMKVEQYGVDDTRGDDGKVREDLILYGPIATAMDASKPSLQLYKAGVYFDPRCCSNNLNHAITIVGYGVDLLMGDYFILKNSWGTSWGDSGYMKILAANNMCGVSSKIVYISQSKEL